MFSSYNTTNCRLAYIKEISYGLLAMTLGIELFNPFYHYWISGRLMMGFTDLMTIFTIAIMNIISRCPKPEMFLVNAGGIIARMAYVHAFWNWAVFDLPDKSRYHRCFPFQLNNSISPPTFCPFPYMASAIINPCVLRYAIFYWLVCKAISGTELGGVRSEIWYARTNEKLFATDNTSSSYWHNHLLYGFTPQGRRAAACEESQAFGSDPSRDLSLQQWGKGVNRL